MSENSDIKAISTGILRYLESQKKGHLLPGICKAMLEQSAGLSQAKVISASSLSAGYKNKITKLVRSSFNVEKVDFLTDPEILGGIKITIGDKIFDLSVNAKLQNLVESML